MMEWHVYLFIGLMLYLSTTLAFVYFGRKKLRMEQMDAGIRENKLKVLGLRKETRIRDLENREKLFLEDYKNNEVLFSELLNLIRKIEIFYMNPDAEKLFREIENTMMSIFQAEDVILEISRRYDIFNVKLDRNQTLNDKKKEIVDEMWKTFRGSKSENTIYEMGDYKFCCLYSPSEILGSEYPLALLALKKPAVEKKFDENIEKAKSVLEAPLTLMFTYKKSELISLSVDSIKEQYTRTSISGFDADKRFQNFATDFKNFVEDNSSMECSSMYIEYYGISKHYPSLDNEGETRLKGINETIKAILKKEDKIRGNDILEIDQRFRQLFQKIFNKLKIDHKIICWPFIVKDGDRFNCIGFIITKMKHREWQIRESDREFVYYISRHMNNTFFHFILPSVAGEKVFKGLMRFLQTDPVGTVEKYVIVQNSLSYKQRREFWDSTLRVFTKKITKRSIDPRDISGLMRAYFVRNDLIQADSFFPVMEAIESLDLSYNTLRDLGFLFKQSCSYINAHNKNGYEEFRKLFRFMLNNFELFSFQVMIPFIFMEMMTEEEFSDNAKTMIEFRNRFKQYQCIHLLDERFMDMYKSVKEKNLTYMSEYVDALVELIEDEGYKNSIRKEIDTLNHSEGCLDQEVQCDLDTLSESLSESDLDMNRWFFNEIKQMTKTKFRKTEIEDLQGDGKHFSPLVIYLDKEFCLYGFRPYGKNIRWVFTHLETKTKKSEYKNIIGKMKRRAKVLNYI